MLTFSLEHVTSLITWFPPTNNTINIITFHQQISDLSSELKSIKLISHLESGRANEEFVKSLSDAILNYDPPLTDWQNDLIRDFCSTENRSDAILGLQNVWDFGDHFRIGAFIVSNWVWIVSNPIWFGERQVFTWDSHSEDNYRNGYPSSHRIWSSNPLSDDKDVSS
jgi:hypothetical protein